MNFTTILKELNENPVSRKEQTHVTRWLQVELEELKAAVEKDQNFYRHLDVDSDNYDAVLAATQDAAIANQLFVEVRTAMDSSCYTRCKLAEATLPSKNEKGFRLSLLHEQKHPKPTKHQKRMRDQFNVGYESLKSRVYADNEASYRTIPLTTMEEAKDAKAEMDRSLAENPSLASVMFVSSRNSALGDMWIMHPATSFDFDTIGVRDNTTYRFVFGYSAKRAKNNF